MDIPFTVDLWQEHTARVNQSPPSISRIPIGITFVQSDIVYRRYRYKATKSGMLDLNDGTYVYKWGTQVGNTFCSLYSDSQQVIDADLVAPEED
jgi:hypothetical protein